ncbi:chloride channel protein [Collinsella provencensis]|uniref:chloride channel protein n=1 Tax=Collinsella provencensis TaxID=1937461 RepID=UPI000C82073F|nr:chloride channel protein [Collinsella provencensis]
MRPKQALETTRDGLTRSTHALTADATRDVRNLRDSLRVYILCIIVAALMGIAGWAFLAALNWATATREAHLWLFLLLPIVNVATAWIYRNHGLRAQRGNNLVIDSTLGGSPIHRRMGLLTFVCSTATHLAGGSAGREGAAVQMGGTIASTVASAFHVTGHDRRDVMMAGISAAFGAAFGTPLAGAFFGMEMCFIGKLDYSAALYCLTGSFVGDFVSRGLGSTFVFQPIGAVPSMQPATIALVIVAAILFGLTARLFTFCIRTVKRFYARFFPNYLAAAVVSGLVLIALFLGCKLHLYGGLSEWLVPAAFRGQTTLADPIAKLGMTALTVGAGFQGGEVTPLFGIGASLGGWFGEATLGEPDFMAALGMLGLFGSALNVPVTTIMLGIDMFGGTAGAYFVIVSFVGYLVAGHSAVYPAQRIITPKRRSLKEDAELSVADALERHRTIVEVHEPSHTDAETAAPSTKDEQ